MRNLQTWPKSKSFWQCGVEQNNYVHNGELLFEGAAKEGVTECEEENEQQYAIRQIKCPMAM